ncbi:MAG: hypothetical protein WBY53_02620 [Acidobacteriaceae bacterium]
MKPKAERPNCLPRHPAQNQPPTHHTQPTRPAHYLHELDRWLQGNDLAQPMRADLSIPHTTSS